MGTWLSGGIRVVDGDSGKVEIILDNLSMEAAQQVMGLMEEYLDAGYYLSPLDSGSWLMIPLDLLDGAGFFN